MSARSQSWRQLIAGGPWGAVAGPTLTAAAAASCIPTPGRIVLPSNFFEIGDVLKLTLAGQISCAVTTPGTARFDVRMGPSGTIVVFDTGALNLNIVAKTNVPFWLEILLTCRAIGASTASNFMGIARFQSEAVIGSVANTVGGNGSLLAPVGAPGVGTGFDVTAANAIDVFFTQTVATGSMTVQQYLAESLN
jgi:hypothetical protein